MIKPTILVTAASGNTGYPVAMQLLAEGYPVRALLRPAPSRRSAARRELLRKAGAEIVTGSMTSLDELVAAMKGAQRAYFCPPWAPNMLYPGAVFMVAARETGLESAVMISQWLADPDHHTVATRQSWFLEQLLAYMPQTSVAVVNPGFFADNYMQLLESIVHLGLMPMSLGNGLNAPPSNEDIARVVAGILKNPAKHSGRTYRPTGPKLLAPQEIASILSTVVDRRVRYIDAPDWMLAKAMRVLGMDPFTQSQVRIYMREYRRNAFAIGAPTDAVEVIANRPAEDFATIARRYMAERPEAQPGFSNKLRAIANFMRIPFTPAIDHDRLVRLQDHPAGGRTVYSAESARWIQTHEPAAAAGAAR